MPNVTTLTFEQVYALPQEERRFFRLIDRRKACDNGMEILYLPCSHAMISNSPVDPKHEYVECGHCKALAECGYRNVAVMDESIEFK